MEQEEASTIEAFQSGGTGNDLASQGIITAVIMKHVMKQFVVLGLILA